MQLLVLLAVLLWLRLVEGLLAWVVGWEEMRLMGWDYLAKGYAKTQKWPSGILHPLEPPTWLHKRLLVVLQLPEKSILHAAEALDYHLAGAWQSCQMRVQDQLQMPAMRSLMLVESKEEKVYAGVGGLQPCDLSPDHNCH